MVRLKKTIYLSFVFGLLCAAAAAQEKADLKGLVPDAHNFEPVRSGDNVIYYKAKDKDGGFIAAVFEAEAKGHSSTIKALTGLTKEGKITAIKIVSQNETAGLGSEVASDNFTKSFSGKNIEQLKGIDAISGATISSSAVIEAVSKKAQEIKELIKDEK